MLVYMSFRVFWYYIIVVCLFLFSPVVAVHGVGVRYVRDVKSVVAMP